MRISKNTVFQCLLITVLFGSGIAFTSNLDSPNWQKTKRIFVDNISSISLLGIIGTLGILVLTTTKDGLIKREEDKWIVLSKKSEDQEKMLTDAIAALLKENEKQFGLFRQDFIDFRGEVSKDYADFKTSISNDLTSFKGEMNQNFADFKGEVSRDLNTFKVEFTTEITSFKGEVSKDFADFTAQNSSETQSLSQRLDQQIGALSQRLDQQTAAIDRNTEKLHQYELKQATIEGRVEEISRR